MQGIGLEGAFFAATPAAFGQLLAVLAERLLSPVKQKGSKLKERRFQTNGPKWMLAAVGLYLGYLIQLAFTSRSRPPWFNEAIVGLATAGAVLMYLIVVWLNYRFSEKPTIKQLEAKSYRIKKKAQSHFLTTLGSAIFLLVFLVFYLG